MIFNRDRDYVVKDGKVVIVDEFTGRMQPGRRYSEGLHQALEAKEGVEVERESKTYATISFQNYFRLYKKLAGMTGTAVTESEEFHKIYKLDVVAIPTHRPMIRKDQPDLVYKNEAAKNRAVVAAIEERHATGQPVLVGTVSIDKSEALSGMLTRRGITHEVLNAKQHEREAGIVALAGQQGAVTIATNMACRGTDIVLGGGVQELGGLHIIGTERHEARRIDNQLRGRSGRQGDPGSSRFYVSLQDDLMRRFGSERIESVMNMLKMDENEPIEHSMVSKALEGAQSKVEGFNFDIRKHLVEYDDVMNEQRALIYRDRDKILTGESMRDYIVGLLEDEMRRLVENHLQASVSEEWDVEGLLGLLWTIVPPTPDFTPDSLRLLSRAEVEEALIAYVHDMYSRLEQAVGVVLLRVIERRLMLEVITVLWVDHLTAIDDLREGINLRAYGQRDPLVEYKREAYTMWQDLQESIRSLIVHQIFRFPLQAAAPPPPPPQVRTNRGEDVEQPATNGQRRATASRNPRQPQVARGGARTPGRNDPCFCGSGKKYKRCHGAPTAPTQQRPGAPPQPRSST